MNYRVKGLSPEACEVGYQCDCGCQPVFRYRVITPPMSPPSAATSSFWWGPMLGHDPPPR